VSDLVAGCTYAFVPQPAAKGNWRLGKNANVAFYQSVYPNWFHRLMQRLILGIYWERV
jgi:hypothetical protein